MPCLTPEVNFWGGVIWRLTPWPQVPAPLSCATCCTRCLLYTCCGVAVQHALHNKSSTINRLREWNRSLTCDREVSSGRGDSLAVFHLALVRSLVGVDHVADGQSDESVGPVVVQLMSLGCTDLLLVLEPLDGRRRRRAVLCRERHRAARVDLVVRTQPLDKLRSCIVHNQPMLAAIVITVICSKLATTIIDP